MIDLTLQGSKTPPRSVTEATLDREGFYIPEPPQRYNPRAKSAIGIGTREQRALANSYATRNQNSTPQNTLGRSDQGRTRPQSAKNRPQSAINSPQTANNRPKSAANFKQISNYDVENCREPVPNQRDSYDIKSFEESVPNSRDSIKASEEKKWIHPREEVKWKPRNSYAHGNSYMYRDRPHKDQSNYKQPVPVCRCEPRNEPIAPPCSPRRDDHILGQRFVPEKQSTKETPKASLNYLNYAKSKPKCDKSKRADAATIASKVRNAFLEEDLSIRQINTNTPSPTHSSETSSSVSTALSRSSKASKQQEVIEIPTMDMFVTDEPDEEATEMVENSSAPDKTWRKQLNKRQNVYKSVYLKEYDKAHKYHTTTYNTSTVDLKVPQPKEPVRYTPNYYRYEKATSERQSAAHRGWDRRQPRPTVGNSKSVAVRRPGNLYMVVS